MTLSARRTVLLPAHCSVEQKKLDDMADEEARESGGHPGRRTASSREKLAEALRVNILSQVRTHAERPTASR